jgi:hypothetical protein
VEAADALRGCEAVVHQDSRRGIQTARLLDSIAFASFKAVIAAAAAAAIESLVWSTGDDAMAARTGANARSADEP